jgi:hypothetical protein
MHVRRFRPLAIPLSLASLPAAAVSSRFVRTPEVRRSTDGKTVVFERAGVLHRMGYAASTSSSRRRPSC